MKMNFYSVKFMMMKRWSKPLIHLIGPAILSFIIIFMLLVGIVCFKHATGWIDKPFAGLLFYGYPIVGSFGDSEWPPFKAGVKYRDLILAVNEQRVLSGKEIQEVITQTPVSENIRLLLDRKGERFSIEVPIILFTFKDFLKAFGIPFIIGVTLWLIGIIVYFLKRDTITSWSFFLFCLFLGIYIVTGFGIQSTIPPWNTYINIINLLGLSFFPGACIHLSFFFPEKSSYIKRWPWIQYIPYFISLIIMTYNLSFFLSLTGARPETEESAIISMQILNTIKINQFHFLLDVNRFYALLAAISIAISSGSALWRSSSIIAKQRARVVLFYSGIAFVPPTVGMALVSLSKITVPFNIFAFFVLFFPIAIAYAIAKHNLFDVDVYIKRTVGFAIMTIIVGMTYFSVQTIMDRVILRPILGESAEKVYPIIFALLVVFLFNPVNRKVQEGVDRLFYRKRYDYKATIASVTNALTSLLDFDEIIKKVIGTVRNEMFIDTAGVIVLDPKKQACQTFFIGDGPNNTKDQARDIPCSYDDPLIALLSKEKRLITRYDIAEDPKYKDMQGACGKRFQEIEATIAIPLIYQDKLTGLLALGNKKSGHFYTREDIDLLTTLASQGTIAIENAKLFKEHLEKGRMEEELKIAHDIQLSMLPDKAPEIEGFKIAAKSIPAREVGGDFYDFIEVHVDGTNKRLGIVIGDVSGKGVSAALMMAASRSIYRVLADAHPSVEDLMSMGNRLLNRDIKKGMFVALLYAELNPEGKILTLSNAGQTKPVICPGDRSMPSFIDTDGDTFPLGIIGDCDYQEKQVPLKEGDTLVFYTDGVVEAMNSKEEMYGFDRLLTSTEEGRGLDAEAMLEKLMNDISNFVGGVEQHDDLTMVVVRVG